MLLKKIFISFLRLIFFKRKARIIHPFWKVYRTWCKCMNNFCRDFKPAKVPFFGLVIHHHTVPTPTEDSAYQMEFITNSGSGGEVVGLRLRDFPRWEWNPLFGFCVLEDFFGFLPVLFPRLFDSAVFSFKNRCLQLVCNLAFFFPSARKIPWKICCCWEVCAWETVVEFLHVAMIRARNICWITFQF